MKSFTFTSLACLMLSAAQAEAITNSAELEHHHVSNQFRNRGLIHQRVYLARNGQNDPGECNYSTECSH